MTRTADVPARNTVYQILCEATLPGLELRPKTLRYRAALLYERICDSLIPLQKVKEPHRRRIALDTTITLCAEYAGKRLVPTTLHSVERLIARCFALYDLQPRCVPHTLIILALDCRGGIIVPCLKDLADQVRDERIRRAYDDGAGYSSLAHHHNLTPRRIRQIVNPG